MGGIYKNFSTVFEQIKCDKILVAFAVWIVLNSLYQYKFKNIENVIDLTQSILSAISNSSF